MAKLPDRSSKSEKIFHMAACTLTLEVNLGHLQWKVTDLERKSGFSRSLIYRYLGGNKETILHNAMEIFVNQFYGLEKSQTKLPFPFVVARARQWIIEYPETALFYQKWRMANASLTDSFSKIEEKFQKKIKKLFPHFSNEELLVAHVCIHGMVTAPFLSATQAGRICERLMTQGILDFKGS